jgi:AcrR family transcriptional regulator
VFNHDATHETAIAPPLTRADRQQQARDVTRRAILDAALELFVADGYPQVSIRNIAAKVGYSPAAIYSYFASKDDIFYALAEEGFRLLGAAQTIELSSADPLDDIRLAAWRLYEFSKRQPQYFALVFLDRRVPRLARDSERFSFMVEIKDAIRTRMQRCIDEGLFPASMSVDVALRLLLAPVFGLVQMRLSGRLLATEDADALVHDAIEVTIAGLRAGAAQRAHVAVACLGSTSEASPQTNEHAAPPR